MTRVRGRFVWGFAVFCLFCLALPMQAQDRRAGLSHWYATFDLAPLPQNVSITAEIIHFEGLPSGVVDLRIYSAPSARCPRDMQQGFCHALRRAAQSDGTVQARVTDVAFVTQNIGRGQVRVNFRLGQDTTTYRLVMTADARVYTASLMGPQGTAAVWAGFAQSSPHLCEQVMCADDIFLLAKGQALTWDTQPDPASGTLVAPSEMLEVMDESGRSLGNVTFGGTSQRPTATGALFGMFGVNTAHETHFTFASQTADAIAFDVRVIDAGSRAQKTGRLMVERPAYAGQSRGSLILGNDVFVVSLAPFGNASTPVEVEEELYDNPGFGIYKYTYALQGIPQGHGLALRQSPDRNATAVTTLNAQARDLQINTCLPDIDNIAFEEASAAVQAQVLSRVWCEIYANGTQGWVPGRYLGAQR